MLLARVAATSLDTAGERSRHGKRQLIAQVLADARSPEDIWLATAYLAGELRQRRTGIGWRTLEHIPIPAAEPTLRLQEVDHALEVIASLSGPGSGTQRRVKVEALFDRATLVEQDFLRGLLTSGLRQGAGDGVMMEAVAFAFGLPGPALRRAVMLGASLPDVAAALWSRGADALPEFTVQPGRPVRPMLAASAPDLESALIRASSGGRPVVVEGKLDGVRIQVHRLAGQVRVFSRSLDEITARVPEIVAAVRELPGAELIIDGEALLMEQGRPLPFQDSAAHLAAQAPTERALTAFFFDLLHADGVDLIDEPLHVRFQRLRDIAPAHLVPRTVTGSRDDAVQFYQAVLADGLEGVVVKDLDARYTAGRRGGSWIKVKPRHTFDLVVIAVEWGSGRRRGTLSNIHLAARDPDTGGMVMLGKTFKGMTDELLTWQTRRFLELEISRSSHTVHLRPEQVVEVAVDGVQRSRRYPGGVALRFARVLRYRDDKTPAEADTLDAIRSLIPREGGGGSPGSAPT